MNEMIKAVAQTGIDEMELVEIERPDVADDCALLKMEAAGICGSDVRNISQMPKYPRILGHENVARVEEIGKSAKYLWGLNEGDLIALEEYMPCHQCKWCHMGEYRHCWFTDNHNNPEGFMRFGKAPLNVGNGLWGGFSEYLYMTPRSVWHRVPEGVSPPEASLHIALGNGVQWACVEGGAGAGKSVLIQGPGQMGTACVIAAKAAGAPLIMITGRTNDEERLKVCSLLGADLTIDVDREDVRDRVMEATGGQGVDVVVDCTSSHSVAPFFVGLSCLVTRGGTIVVQGSSMDFTNDPFPMQEVGNRYVFLKQARGHSYASVDRGFEIMASGKFNLDLMHTNDFPLEKTLDAIHAIKGELVDGHRALHVSVLPWS